MSESQPLPNHWGQHQPRLTLHTDGTVRLLYLRYDASGHINWRVMKRSPASSAWSLEASGLSQDDVTLLRDPISDLAHVVAWPDSIPTAYTTPGFVGQVIPGNWQRLGTASRHYGNAGIGSDGTLCLKASAELASIVPTTRTVTQVTCGRHNQTGGGWAWNSPFSVDTGLRRAYDYLFPGAFGIASQMVATSQLDLYKTAAGTPTLFVAAGNYVFNGISVYNSPVTSSAGWRMEDLVAPRPVQATATSAPVERQNDAYVDRRNQLVTTFWLDDPAAPSDSGHHLLVTDARNARLFGGRLTQLPRYGHARVFDDSQGRLWLLWTNLGTQKTQVELYRVQQQGSGVALSDRVDLSGQFEPYAIQGAPLIAVPRGGQAIGNALDGLMFACDGVFQSNRLNACYPASTNRQRVVYFRLTLPD